MSEASKPISRVRVVFDDPMVQVDDLVGQSVGKYGMTGKPFLQALLDGRQSVVAAINAAYDFEDEPLQPEMMEAMESYFDSDMFKTTLCVVVKPKESQRENIKQRLEGRRVQKSQPSNGQVMQMLATLQAEVSQLKSNLSDSTKNNLELEKARASDRIASEGVKEKNTQLEGMLGKLNAAITRLEGERASDRAAITRLEGESASVRAAITRLEGESASVRAAITRLEEKGESLEESLERSRNEVTALKAEISEVKSELKIVIDDLCRTTSMLMPLHLCVLLDLARNKVIQLLDIESWDDLQRSRPMPQLAHYIEAELKHRGVACTLSLDALTNLCSYNNVRREGNRAAHRASHAEIRQAIMGSPIEYQNRGFLEEVYKFRFEVSVYEDTRNEQLTC